ncbi:hypothetical protein [Actinomadura madurae]|uniref:hypothetical protein n=1 Tax=Actinomadura madurae TaxID=1993 RepID=UPI0020D1FD55|nr:hypothetical protein [Actinomadura madurae]MCP9950628.1 hypothetical protein [Actinomadura madurae]MCP9967404.1 hypothetical protein [Actinomadura madurae]MCP9979862.1 hypothetical protein [Actinomadura madurae]
MHVATRDVSSGVKSACPASHGSGVAARGAMVRGSRTSIRDGRRASTSASCPSGVK